MAPGRYEDSTLQAVVETDIDYLLMCQVVMVMPRGFGEAPRIQTAPFTFLSPMFPIMEDDSSWVDFRTGDSVYYADADSCI